MRPRVFAVVSLVVIAAAAPARAAVVSRADETSVQGDVVGLQDGKLTVATRGADGAERRVVIPLDDVVEVNFDPNAVAPAAPAAPAVAGAAAPRGGRKGVSAYFYNAQFWNGPKPASSAVGPGRAAANAGAISPAKDTFVIVAVPDVSKTLPTLSNSFGQDSPAEGINPDEVSAAFAGRIRPKLSGEYTFLCRSDDDHWLLVDGHLVCSDPGAHGARDPREGAAPETVVPIKLEAGKDYDFLFLANEGLVDFTAVAQWVPPGKSEPEDIPEDCLFAETGAPPAPTDLAVVETTDTGVKLRFRDTATNEIRFSIERATDAAFTNPVTAGNAPINATSFTDSGLKKGTTYFYRVRAVNFEGSSPPAVVSATPGAPAPRQAVASAPAAPPAAAAARPAAAPNQPPVPKQKGVSARYFATQFWKSNDPRVSANEVTVIGEPDVKAVVPSLENDFGEGSPDPKIPDEHFSTAYFGKVRTKDAGEYLFLGYSDDDHYLYVNGQLVSVDTGAHGPRDPREGSNRDQVKPIRLAANTEYDILYLQNENIGGASATVRWVPPGASEPAEVPADNLSTATGVPAAPTEFAADASAGNAVKLTFKDVATNEIRYVLERAPDGSFTAQKVTNFLPINATGFNDATVKPGEVYFYRLSAVNFEGQSEPVAIRVAAGEKGGSAVAAAPVRPAPGAVPVATPGKPAATAPAAGPKADAEGFVSIFNGKDLTGWRGLKNEWKVEDGAIAAASPEGQTRDGSDYLVWDGGSLSDFELRLKFKIEGMNSGVQFRSRLVDDVGFQVAGYQADLSDERPVSGSVWDQGGNRGTLGHLGHKTTHKADGSEETEPLATPAEQVQESIKRGDWNEMTVAASGDTITIKINGVESAVLVDDDPQAEKEGVIALQLDHYWPGTVRFKDIKLKVPAGKWPTAGLARAPATAPASAPATAPAPASAPARPAAVASVAPVKSDGEGFVPIFNGTDFTGWEGDTNRWKVEEGAITGTVHEGESSNGSTYLVWGGGDVSDFELRLRFKPTSVNGGVQFRSRRSNPRQFQVIGLQVDIADNRPITGTIWDQGGSRGTVAALGVRTTHNADGTEATEPLAAGAGAAEALKAGDWNDLSIKAVGNRTTVTVNGVTTAELVDDDPRASRDGVLALQLQLDPQMPGTIQYKDIRLKVLGGPRPPGLPEAVASAPESQPAPPADAWTFQLAGGDRLTGTVKQWTDKQVILHGEAGEVAVPLRRLREAWRGTPTDAAKQARAAAGGPVAEDTAFVEAEKEVRSVRGVTLGVDGDSLKFRFNDRDRRIALNRLVGIVFGETPDPAADRFAGSFHQSVLLASGDSLSGTWVALANGAVELRTPWDASVKVPLEKVTKVKCRNGRLVYLADLSPLRVEQTPYFDRVVPFQVDRSLTGGWLKMSDGPVDRGIAVHSRCVLHYDAGGAYARLKGKVGFQDPEGKLGNAFVRISGDGKPLFERPEARGDQPPQEFDVDVRGVKTLTLEVDFGQGQDVGDRVVWANPRLLRASPGR